VTGAVRARDGTRWIINHHMGIQAARLCPEHERDWLLRNSMAMWNTDLTLDPDNLLNGLSNVILLRSGFHTAFGDRKFVPYPKAKDGYVVHMLEPTPDRISDSCTTCPLLQCNPRFISARFAWGLFQCLAEFLRKPGVSRYRLGVERVNKE
jgi:hypothetical protein